MVGANLRVLFGDNRGAIDFLDRAAAQTSPTEVEEQAWIANKIASILIDQVRLIPQHRLCSRRLSSSQTIPMPWRILPAFASLRTGPRTRFKLLLQAHGARS